MKPLNLSISVSEIWMAVKYCSKIPSIKIMDLAKAINPNKNKLMGVKPGEKLHEIMCQETMHLT